MPRYKIVIDPETLSFIKVQTSFFKSLPAIITKHVPFTLVASILICAVLLKIVESPQERELLRQKDALESQYSKINEKCNQKVQLLTEIEKRDNELFRKVFEMDPIPSSVRMSGIGGSYQYIKYKEYSNLPILQTTLQSIDKLAKQIVIQSTSFDQVEETLLNKEKMLRCIPAIQPIEASSLTSFGSYGMRLHPIFKVWKMHYGIDLCCKHGTPVYAAGDGKVVKAAWGDGYGNQVTLDHQFGYGTIYAHLSKILVKEGQEVKRGECIGLVGATGWAVAAHLHYEVIKNGRPTDPIRFYVSKDLNADQYQNILDMAEKGAGELD